MPPQRLALALGNHLAHSTSWRLVAGAARSGTRPRGIINVPGAGRLRRGPRLSIRRRAHRTASVILALDSVRPQAG
eukprot:10238189-Lingulodinium_polyedra.AAC.1